MPTGLRFLSHSSLLLEDDDGDLLMDPWFFGDVFNGAWSLLAPPDLDALDLGRLRHVWISHSHPDHLHVPTLRWVRSRVAGPLTAYVRHSPNPTVRDTMADLGFDVVELRANRERRVTENLSLTLYTAGRDSSLVIRHRDRVILNQNDCVLADSTIRRLKRRFPRIDAWLYQFSIGGYSPTPTTPRHSGRCGRGSSTRSPTSMSC
jgi:ribonuclease BN (tRNA processing enzyme)